METDATYRGTVYPWQCDHVGHMNIMWYVGKFDEANWNLFARLGLTPTYLRESGRGMAARAAEHHLQARTAGRRHRRGQEHGCWKSATSRSASCTRCATPKPARSPRPAKSPACTWTGRRASRRRSRPRSVTRLQNAPLPNRRWPERMPRFEPKNPDYRAIATATFERQRAMKTLGISIARLEPGEVDLAMDYSADFTQQNGFIHAGIITAGLDNACGIAAFTLMPAASGHPHRGIQDQPAGAGAAASALPSAPRWSSPAAR